MLSKMNKSENKNLKKIGKILSTFHKNNKNISDVEIITDRFQDSNSLSDVNNIQKINVKVYDEKNIEKVKSEVEEIKRYLSPETIFKVTLKTK